MKTISYYEIKERYDIEDSYIFESYTGRHYQDGTIVLCKMKEVATYLCQNIYTGKIFTATINELDAWVDKLICTRESILHKLLIRKNINFTRECGFADLRSEHGNMLRFDFALLDKDGNLIMLVEVNDDRYHNKHKAVLHDKLKSDYCVRNYIPFFTLWSNQSTDEVLSRYKFLKKANQRSEPREASEAE